ncbi:hypothetical protein INR49_014921 [Caranx melampygus]|nr:hypothetical protein INR49_014921 [Caranx melampygus]
MWYAVVLSDRELNPAILNGLPGLPGIPGTVPLVSGRAPAPFWFLSLGWLAPGCAGVGTPCPGAAGPGTAGVTDPPAGHALVAALVPRERGDPWADRWMDDPAAPLPTSPSCQLPS